MKRLFSIVAAFVLAATMAAPIASAQGNDPLIVNASEFAQWTAISNTAVAASSGQSFTVRGYGLFASPRGQSFIPFSTSIALNIEAAGGTAETVTPSSVTCPMNGLLDACTVVATFSYAHNSGFKITSGDLGVGEAKAATKTGTLIYVHKFTDVTLTAAATFTSSNFIPAGVFLDGITVNVLTAITKAGGATTLWTFGDGTTADLWGTGLALAAGTTTSYANYKTNYGSIGIVKSALTPTGTATTDNFAGGVVRINITYHVINQN